VFVGNKIDLREVSNKNHISSVVGRKKFIDELHLQYL
jgi:hypothetical protein